jgi:hypothetical protein
MAWGKLPLLGRLYTWTNKQNPPVLPRLDRAFINNSWSGIFPHSILTSLPRPIKESFYLNFICTKINSCLRVYNVVADVLAMFGAKLRDESQAIWPGHAPDFAQV